MLVVELINITGHSPYDVYICDYTNTYCYLVESGLVECPPTIELDIPTQLEDVDNLIVKVIDSEDCEVFKVYTCPPTPTPTPTNTPTTTPTPTNGNCNCLRITNPTSGPLSYSYIGCDSLYYS